jgi:hypothetical protein
MFIVGQYVEERELGLNSSCVVFPGPIELGSVNIFVLDLFLSFLSVLAGEHAPNEWVKEVVLHFF